MQGEFLEILGIACAVAGSSRAVLTRENFDNNKLVYLTNTSGEWAEMDSAYAHPALSKDSPISLLPPGQFAARFNKHPLRTMMPQIRSLATYHVYEGTGGRWALTISNPSLRYFSSDEDQAVVERLVTLMRGLIRIENQHHICAQAQSSSVSAGLEESPAELPADESALQFLKDTLTQKPRLLSRKAVAYIAVRAWAKPIKTHQVKALAAIKSGCTRPAAKVIAGEMESTILKVFGMAFDCIVPMPPGSSGRPDCLSVTIGEELSARLKIPCLKVLRTQGAEPGKSHPKKSSRLAPFLLAEKVKGRVLLVDDVASSGRHIELARDALEKAGCTVSAIAWVSD